MKKDKEKRLIALTSWAREAKSLEEQKLLLKLILFYQDKEKDLTFLSKIRSHEENISEFERKTDSTCVPMKNWSRVIIETIDKHPRTLAVVTNDDFELADGIGVRFLPAPNN
ncbi:MAG: hypothetical protein K2M17_00345 [Bacilli bacterium]|nr:hypothetical protein [Bacilli bacterium]